MQQQFKDNSKDADTTIGMPSLEFIKVAEDLDFEKVGEFQPNNSVGNDKKFIIYAHRDGFILSLDISEGRISDATVVSYCIIDDNVSLPDFGYLENLDKGGREVKKFVITGFDARENFRKNMQFLQEKTQIIKPIPATRDVELCFISEIEIPGYKNIEELSNTIGQQRKMAMPTWVKAIFEGDVPLIEDGAKVDHLKIVSILI